VSPPEYRINCSFNGGLAGNGNVSLYAHTLRAAPQRAVLNVGFAKGAGYCEV
jgi:hypothetical protein